MRPTTVLLLALSILSSVTRVRAVAAERNEGGAYHIVFPRHAVAAGEHVELRLVPAAPESVRVNWFVSGKVGIGLNPPGVYRAPFVIPIGTPPARVSAGFSSQGLRVNATAEIELTPSSAPGAEDCLGPGQSFSTVLGDIEPGPGYDLEELPELIHSVEAEYPKSLLARGVEDTLVVQVLVCRNGHVLDANVLPRYPTRTEPVAHDPKRVDAALAAVRQYVFKPATVAGQGIAIWVAVPVTFRR